MSDSASWWARRLGQQAPPAVYQQPQAPTPPHNQYPQVPQHMHGAPENVNPNAVNEAQAIQAARTGMLDPMQVIAAAGTRGGKAARTETQNCPSCDSPHYFQRKALSKMGASPAPYCHTCGYNGLFEQYGAQDIMEGH
jgi:hypothetical protein